jgi:hypothetical protein
LIVFLLLGNWIKNILAFQIKATQYEGMLSRFFYLLIILTLSSCSLFRAQNIENKNIEDLVNYLQGVGEGKGRLGINNQQYLFSFDALLKENNDWILAASIPLHGEEVLMLRDLKQEKIKLDHRDGLELRIVNGISEYLRFQKQSPELAQTFILELRRMMRLVLHKKLNLKVDCDKAECRIGEVIYQVEATSKQLTLKKSLSNDYEIVHIAMNLTDSIFERSSIFLHSKKGDNSASNLLSLELFWK